MRIQTIHRNKLGDVHNECSAHGFEITTGDGTRITVMVDDDRSIRAAPQQPAAVDEAAAQRLADAVKADLGWSHLTPQARVEKARKYLTIAAQQPAAVDGAMVERATDPVRALVGQWRDAAEFFTGDAGSDIRETLMACARELEVALAAQQQEARNG